MTEQDIREHFRRSAALHKLADIVATTRDSAPIREYRRRRAAALKGRRISA